MPYSSFRFRSVVDWIELEIHTQTPTNFWTLQNTLREIQKLPEEINPYVKPLDEGAGGAASNFSFRFQEPSSLHEVKRLLDEVTSRFELKGPLLVTAIEIALDAYGANPEQAARFYKFATKMVSKNRRLYRELNVDKVHGIPANFKSLVRHLSEGWQIAVGDNDADYYQHIYWKTTDNNGTPLPESEHRARIEITLRGAALPHQELDYWEGFKFKSLSAYFRFRTLKFGLDPMMLVLADANDQIGELHKRNRKEGGTRLYSKLTLADTPLNGRARDALRELTRRWQAKPKPRKSRIKAGAAIPTAC
jgi:hypothetical protein